MTLPLDLLLTGGRILADGALHEGLALGVSGQRIAWLGAEAEAPLARHIVPLGGDMLLPGFIDVQVNGGGGALLSIVRLLRSQHTLAASLQDEKH